jgi:dTDP-4-dehydrorhamnose reductase
MFGHQLFKTLRVVHEARVTLRQPFAVYKDFNLFDGDAAFDQIDAGDVAALDRIFSNFRPEAVVNGIGLVKQRDNTKDMIANLETNALLPHRLANLCETIGARLIQISTDCVFSGRRGMYTENDVPDAEDIYGRTKLLGEVTGRRCLTLRTSIIGRELARKRSLLEWFLVQQGIVKGFRQAIFSGFSTIELSRIVQMLLERFPDAEGLYHVSAEPIDKCALLQLFRERFARPVEIVPDDSFVIDRSLDSSRFRKAFHYIPPGWREMVEEL